MRPLSMRTTSYWLAMLLCLAATGLGTALARADDNIFPPSPAAKAFIDFDGRGFLVNGKRTFLVSGSLHYARVPRALWRDRLLRMKRAGFNTVETYAFWNFHETQEGKWDFSGDKDVDAFLKLVHAVGLFAVVRVGPYVCAEWDSGGYPVWLRFKPGVRVREDNPEFEAVVDRWYEKILPIVAANQIHRGGAVLMVQLENEHPKGWGRDMPNDYFRHLRTKALALGIEVPSFFSGLHHGSDPAGNNPWDSKGRSSPWYTTEFWPGWYDRYGPLDANSLRRFDRGTWKIIAYGGNGYNYYMLHGGTDFDTWNDDEVASSYDYGGAIGQAGDLRPVYYRFKRAAWFARSFQRVLEDSENVTETYKGAATGAGVRVTARQSPAGTILFLDNSGREAVPSQIKAGEGVLYPTDGPLTVAAGEILPVVLDYALTSEVKLELGAARVLGILEQEGVTTLVVYGAPGEPAELHFALGAQPFTVLKGAPALARDPDREGRLRWKARFPALGPEEYTFDVTSPSGKRKVRILAVSTALADRTWFLETGETNGKQVLVCGPDYVGEVEAKQGHLQLLTESRLPAGGEKTAEPRFLLVGPGDSVPLRPEPLSASGREASRWQAPALAAWRMRRADAEAQPRFNDAGWKASDTPLPMGADGDISAYAWYRATVHAPAAGAYNLRFGKAGDWIAAFINGQPAGSSGLKGRRGAAGPTGVDVQLQAGNNTLAVLAAHYGRPKLFAYLGPIDRVDSKGLMGPVTLVQGAVGKVAVTHWRWRADPRGEKAAAEMAAPEQNTDGGDWKDAVLGQDVFHGQKGFAWYRAQLNQLPAAPPNTRRTLHFESVDDNATVYLNGKRLLKHEGWADAFDVPIDDAWRAGGPNVLAVLVENTAGVGGIMGAVEIQALAGTEVTGWKMRGGIGAPMGEAGAPWQPLAAGTGSATWYRTEFTSPLPAAVGPHPVLRVSLPGMSRGFVWLNGHNLGRYPEKVPVEGLYLPECWLMPGKNTLVLFDEEGKAPEQVHLVVESAASRTVVAIEAPATP